MIFSLDLDEKKFQDILREKADQLNNNILNVIDVGAANGGLPFYMMNFFWKSELRFHLFEPGRTEYNKLVKMANLHPWILCKQMAVSDVQGSVELVQAKVAEHSHIFMPQETEDTRIVPSIRLDTYIANSSLKDIFFLKIDTEGAEFKVLDGLGAQIKLVQNIQLEYGSGWEREPRSIRECISYLEFCGFHGYQYAEDKLERIESVSFQDNFVMRNLLFVRDSNGIS